MAMAIAGILCMPKEVATALPPGPSNYNPNSILYTEPWHRTGNTGVMMVPYTGGKGDFAEQTVFLSAGEMPVVNRVYAPSDGMDMFKKLGALARMGDKSVDLLVIAGHSPEGQSAIMFGNGAGLLPDDVNSIEDLNRLEAASPGINTRGTQAMYDKARLIVGCRNLMAPDATIVILNCHALDNAEGRAFVRMIGRLLLGNKGGRIIASPDLVETIQITEDTTKLRWLWDCLKTGRWLTAGDTAYAPQVRGGVPGRFWAMNIEPGSYPKLPSKLAAELSAPASTPPAFPASTQPLAPASSYPAKMTALHKRELLWPTTPEVVNRETGEYKGKSVQGYDVVASVQFYADGSMSMTIQCAKNGFEGTYSGKRSGANVVEGEYIPSAGFGPRAYFQAKW
jgi:hypothetical protein